MFWELYQQSQIHDAQEAANRAVSKSNDFKIEISRLENKIESLALTCQALWEIVRDEAGLSDEQLRDKVSEIDLRDGVADGKMGINAKMCGKCGRPMSRRRLSCLYCGEPASSNHVFQQP